MMQIINGLLYDTTSAKLIYLDETNNRRWYKTQNGNYFVLYGTGEIAQKSEEAVKDYLGQRDVEKYIELFGEPQEA